MIKRINSIVTCLCLLFTLIPCFQLEANADTPAANNVLINGDFETGATAPWSVVDGGKLSLESTIVHSGLYAAKHERANKYEGVGQTITIKRNRIYTYSAWVYATAPATNYFIYAREPGAGSYEYKQATPLTPIPANTWTQLTGDYSSTQVAAGKDPNVATIKVYVNESGGTASPIIYSDDYSVTPKYILTKATISGADGIAASPESDKIVKYTSGGINQAGTTTDMQYISTTWSVTDVNGNALTNGITINQNGELFVPAGTQNSGSIKVQATVTDLGVQASAEKIITFGSQVVNLVKNPGFESGTTADWTANGGTMTATQEQAHSGSYAIKISGRTANNNGPLQTVPILLGRTYTYSAWIKSSAEVGTNDTFYLLDNQQGYATLAPNTRPNSTTWTQIIGDKNISGTGTKNLAMLLLENNEAPFVDTIYADDFCVSPKYTISSIDIKGASKIRIPQSGTQDISYNQSVKNQVGTVDEMPQTVVWSLLNPIDGVTINPSSGILTIGSTATAGNITVVATATEFNVSTVSKKTVSVDPYISNIEVAQKAADALTGGIITTEKLNYITKNLSLPTSGEYGAAITWSSNNTSVVSDSGVVVSPVTTTDVELTATITMESDSLTKVVNITVPAIKNLMSNSGFEDADMSKWLKNGGTATPTTEQAHSGSYSLKFSKPLQNWHRLYQSIPIENGVEYVYSAWVKLPQGAAPRNVQFVNIAKDPADKYNYISPAVTVNADSWTQVIAKYTTTTPNRTTANVDVYLNDSTLLDYYIDDFVVYKSNGSAEFAPVKMYNGGSDSVSYLDDGVTTLSNPVKGNVASNIAVQAGLQSVAISVVMAVYDGDKLVNCSVKSESINKADIKNIYSTVYCDNANYKVKVIIIDGLDTVKPLAPFTALGL